MPEEQLITRLAESGASYLLLGYVIYRGVALLETLTGSVTAMAKDMTANNAQLSALLRDEEQRRAEHTQQLQELILLQKVAIQRLEENRHG